MALTGLIYNTSKVNDREQWRRSLAEAGLTLVDGSFEEGATANSKTDAVWHIAAGQCYSWGGDFPKAVSAKSTPETSGGVGLGAWVSVGDASLRSDLTSDDGAGLLGFSHAESYAAGSVGFRLKNSIDITDAPYNAKPDGSDISAALSQALNTGLPVYIPDTGDAAFKVTGTVVVTSSATMYGPTGAKIEFDGVAAGGNHILFKGGTVSISGMTLTSLTRAVIIRVHPDTTAVSRVDVVGTNFSGGFYSVKCGREVEESASPVVSQVTISNCKSTAPNAGNAGHFQSTHCEYVRYLDNHVVGGLNSSALGITSSTRLVITGNTQSDMSDTVNYVEAAIQVEDCGIAQGVISNNVCEHDIWISSSSNITISNNICRTLRMSVGNPGASGCDSVIWANNRAANVHISKYGSAETEALINAEFTGNTLLPSYYLINGNPIEQAVFLGFNVGAISFTDHLQNDASDYGFRIQRTPNLHLTIAGKSYLGSKPHSLTGSGGIIEQSKSVVAPIGDVSTIYGFASTQTILASDFSIPSAMAWNRIPMVRNRDINSNFITDNNSFVPSTSGTMNVSISMAISATSAGVDFGLRLLNATTNAEVWRVGQVTSSKAGLLVISGDRDLPLDPNSAYVIEVFTSEAGQSITADVAVSRAQFNKIMG